MPGYDEVKYFGCWSLLARQSQKKKIHKLGAALVRLWGSKPVKNEAAYSPGIMVFPFENHGGH